MNLLKRLWQAFNEDKVLRLASSIAFSAIFSIAPLLVVLIAVVGYVLGLENGGHGRRLAEATLLRELRTAAGSETADTVQKLVTAAFAKPRENVVAQVIGWSAFALGAASLFSSLQDSLNAIWHVESTNGGISVAIRTRLAAFLMILVAGFLLLLTFIANTVIVFLVAHFNTGIAPVANPLIVAALERLISYALVVLVFAMIYKVLPAVTIAWRDVWLGASVTAGLFLIGELVISRYLVVAGVASAYGAAGSLLAALLWIYYSAIILLVGAEFTKLRAGPVETVAPSRIRCMRLLPAGIDPREAAHS